MIREFALEPRLAAKWNDRRSCRLFKIEFGLGTGRIVSRFPDNWRAAVLKEFFDLNPIDGLEPQSEAKVQHALERVTELVQRLAEVMADRKDFDWVEEMDWLENAILGNRQREFDVVVTRTRQAELPNCIGEENCLDDHPLWKAPRTRIVSREPLDLRSCVEPALRACTEAVFVDPYWGASNHLSPAPTREYFDVLFRSRLDRPPNRVEFVSGHPSTPDFFFSESKKRYGPLIPRGSSIIVWHVSERPRGEELHNRYLLTDLGGVDFGAGLGKGRMTQIGTDDVDILDEAAFRFRWHQYGELGSPGRTFLPDKYSPFEIKGTGRV